MSFGLPYPSNLEEKTVDIFESDDLLPKLGLETRIITHSPLRLVHIFLIVLTSILTGIGGIGMGYGLGLRRGQNSLPSWTESIPHGKIFCTQQCDNMLIFRASSFNPMD